MKTCKACDIPKPLEDFYPHKTTRDRLSQACRVCTNARSKRYREANSARLRQKAAEYRDRNRETHNRRSREYAARNREKSRENCRKYYRDNKADRKAYNARYQQENKERLRPYYAAKTARYLRIKWHATPKWANLSAILEVYQFAGIMTEMTGTAWHVDHIVPLNSPIVCGLHVEYNLSVIPAAANLAKGNKF